MMPWNKFTKVLGATVVATGLLVGAHQSASALEAAVGIDLTGTVLTVVVITLDDGTYTGLPLQPDDSFDATITNQNELTNNTAGYTVFVNSANLVAGSRCTVTTKPCLWDSVSGDDVDFDVRDPVTPATLLTFVQPDGATWIDSNDLKLTLTPDRPVALVYTIATDEVHPTGDYTDRLTFTIRSK